MKSTYSETYRSLIDRLVSARKAKGITQTNLAQKLGRPQSFVSKIENGERRLDVVEFIEIAHLIGEDPRDIIDALGNSMSRATAHKT